MNSPIDRLRTAADAIGKPLHQPDLFERSVWLVDEITTASATIAAHLVELRVARTQRCIEALERANTEIGKLLGQSATLSAVLADQIAKHKAGRAP